MINRGCASVSTFLFGVLLLGYFLRPPPLTLYGQILFYARYHQYNNHLVVEQQPQIDAAVTTADHSREHYGNDHGYGHGNDHGHGHHGNDHGHGFGHGNGNDNGHGGIGFGNDHHDGHHTGSNDDYGDYSQYWVTLVNECPATVFFGVSGPSSVIPFAGEPWMAEAGQSVSVHIPNNWLGTDVPGKKRVVGPRFWARTGCKYDLDNNKAQCETGDCGNFVDCSAANLAGRAPTSLAEFCFECGDGYTYYDVSLVDGYSVGIDILPGDPHSIDRPGDPTNPFWCISDMCLDGTDIRTECPEIFSLYNTNLTSYNSINDPITKIACFSNCGKYEYPIAPESTCADSDEQCKYWRQYCCQAETYGKSCLTSNECTDGGACWNGTCQCRPYYVSPPCSSSICTNPDAMPSPAICSDCVGDDTLHHKCPRAYTWPNDPQTYSCDATTYTIRFCPGGSVEPITPSLPIPLCSQLDDQYDWPTAQVDCGESHGNYLCAVKKIAPQNIWSCNVDVDSCDNVLCKWDDDEEL